MGEVVDMADTERVVGPARSAGAFDFLAEGQPGFLLKTALEGLEDSQLVKRGLSVAGLGALDLQGEIGVGLGLDQPDCGEVAPAYLLPDCVGGLLEALVWSAPHSAARGDSPQAHSPRCPRPRTRTRIRPPSP
jgi:hypothetical protein